MSALDASYKIDQKTRNSRFFDHFFFENPKKTGGRRGPTGTRTWAWDQSVPKAKVWRTMLLWDKAPLFSIFSQSMHTQSSIHKKSCRRWWETEESEREIHMKGSLWCLSRISTYWRIMTWEFSQPVCTALTAPDWTPRLRWCNHIGDDINIEIEFIIAGQVFITTSTSQCRH